MYFILILVFGVLSGHVVSSTPTAPNYCTYSGGEFTCDYTSMVSGSDRPIDFNQFSPTPQRLKVNVNGVFPFLGDTQVFSVNFSSIDVTAFDRSFPASLTIDCSVGGSLYFTAGGFANMSYVQRLEIKNCDTVYVPSSMFAELENLDYFGIENGIFDGVDPNAFYQLNIEKLTSQTHTFPRPLGTFEIRHSTFPNKVVPPGLLFNWKNLTGAYLVGADIETLTSDIFRYNTKLNYIDLSENLFTALPSEIFDNLDALAEVTLNNIDWACTCADLWFVPYVVQNNITLHGDFMCSSPAGQTVFKYYYDSCITSDACKGVTGLVIMDHCYNVFAMTSICVGFVAMVISITCLILVCQAKKQAVAGRSNRRVKARGRWNKIMDKSMASKLKGLTKKK